MPLDSWRPTKDTLHLYLQIVGKIRLATHPRINHWWHVPLYVTSRGLSTLAIPYGGAAFEIELDFQEHCLRMRTSTGGEEDFALFDGLTVADFYQSVFANLNKLGIRTRINAVPYEAPSSTPFAEDRANSSYDKDAVAKAHALLVWADAIMMKFRGQFTGKSTPVHLFWHSFDLALTRFSGRPAPPIPGANRVTREAYSHEVISFGFWFGDDNVPGPAFYSYTAPEPAGLTDRPLPGHAKWQPANGSHLAVMMYDDVREAASPEDSVMAFLDAAYVAGADLAGWERASFEPRAI